MNNDEISPEAIINTRMLARALAAPLKKYLTFREVMYYIDKEKTATAKFLSENCIPKNAHHFYRRSDIDSVLDGKDKIGEAANKIKL